MPEPTFEQGEWVCLFSGNIQGSSKVVEGRHTGADNLPPISEANQEMPSDWENPEGWRCVKSGGRVHAALRLSVEIYDELLPRLIEQRLSCPRPKTRRNEACRIESLG